jgi:hypothetical protein
MNCRIAYGEYWAQLAGSLDGSQMKKQTQFHIHFWDERKRYAGKLSFSSILYSHISVIQCLQYGKISCLDAFMYMQERKLHTLKTYETKRNIRIHNAIFTALCTRMYIKFLIYTN